MLPLRQTLIDSSVLSVHYGPRRRRQNTGFRCLSFDSSFLLQSPSDLGSTVTTRRSGGIPSGGGKRKIILLVITDIPNPVSVNDDCSKV